MSEEILVKINTGIATVLSAIFPGLGQFYNGKLTKGFVFFIIGGLLFYRAYIFFIAKLDPIVFIIKGFDDVEVIIDESDVFLHGST